MNKTLAGIFVLLLVIVIQKVIIAPIGGFIFGHTSIFSYDNSAAIAAWIDGGLISHAFYGNFSGNRFSPFITIFGTSIGLLISAFFIINIFKDKMFGAGICFYLFVIAIVAVISHVSSSWDDQYVPDKTGKFLVSYDIVVSNDKSHFSNLEKRGGFSYSEFIKAGYNEHAKSVKTVPSIYLSDKDVRYVPGKVASLMNAEVSRREAEKKKGLNSPASVVTSSIGVPWFLFSIRSLFWSLLIPAILLYSFASWCVLMDAPVVYNYN